MRIEPVKHSSGIFPGTPHPSLTKSKEVQLSTLRSGQVLAQEVRTADGTLIAAANTKLTPMVLARLLGIRGIDAVASTLLIHGE